MTQRVMERLVTLGSYGVDHLPGPGDTLVIAFSSIGHDPTRPPSPEFVAAATAGGRPALFVTDGLRSWTHAPGFAMALERAVGALQARQPIRRIITLGQSMGGFAALVAAELLTVDAVLAFGPQSRLDDPDDKRWSDWLARLALQRPAPPVPMGPWLCLFHGLLDDAAQAARFPVQRGLDHFLFANQGHSGLTAHLKARGLLQGLVDAASMGDRRRLVRIVTGAGGVLRRAGQLPR